MVWYGAARVWKDVVGVWQVRVVLLPLGAVGLAFLRWSCWSKPRELGGAESPPRRLLGQIHILKVEPPDLTADFDASSLSRLRDCSDSETGCPPGGPPGGPPQGFEICMLETSLGRASGTVGLHRAIYPHLRQGPCGSRPGPRWRGEGRGRVWRGFYEVSHSET